MSKAATEKRMISLDEAIAKVKDDGVLGEGYSDDERIDDVIDILESCHTVDAVEVTRCKDCFANGCCSVQIDLDMGDEGYCSKGRKESL